MTSLSDFNLGDFIEELPYEDGSGSPDEYISNALIIKRLQLRNEELKSVILEKDKRYVPSSDAKYYIGISKRKSYEYSAKIDKLEAELKALREFIKARKAIEENTGDATEMEPSHVFQVRSMTQQVLERINSHNDLLHPEGEDDL